MGTVITVTSGKGGTGKTSITGAVAASLSLMDRTVLCIDMDIGLRNLDISLGLNDRALMDFSDVVIHVFSRDDRRFYDLERIWRDGKVVEMNENQTDGTGDSES